MRDSVSPVFGIFLEGLAKDLTVEFTENLTKELTEELIKELTKELTKESQPGEKNQFIIPLGKCPNPSKNLDSGLTLPTLPNNKKKNPGWLP